MKKLVLIDGHSILNRAFYGLPDMTNSDGVHTNAVYGFLSILQKVIAEEQPDALTVAFDLSAPTFRHKKYSAYKGTRKPMAPELRQQVPLMKEMLSAMGIVTVEQEGYEADDLLGTMGTHAAEEGWDVTIVSGDRDLLQLASDRIRIYLPKTKKTGTEVEIYDALSFTETYGVTPKEFIDVKALWGDTADNIPGVPGIGEKTAFALIARYHSIENAHEHAAELKPPRAAKNIVEYYDQALLSKDLATIRTDAKMAYDPNNAALSDFRTPEAYEMCRRLGFRKFLSEFETTEKSGDAQEDFSSAFDQKSGADLIKQLDFSAPALGVASLSTADGLVGIAVSDGGNVCFFAKEALSAQSGLKEQLLRAADRSRLCFFDMKPALSWLLYDEAPEESENISRMRQEESGLFSYCFREEIRSEELFDAVLAAYLLDPLLSAYPADRIADQYLTDYRVPTYEELFGKARPERVFSDPTIPEVCGFACRMAQVALLAADPMTKAVSDAGMLSLYETMELPLCFCLTAMEHAGIYADRDALGRYGSELSDEVKKVEQHIYDEAPEPFNLNSPKQLGHVLFDEMHLPVLKKTKTGYSTSADVLEKLAPEYPIVADILTYRQLAKLKSTYADGLFDCIASDGRIHTTFQQTVTATGRLSSTDPNLQNIPIRMEQGRKIRKVFLPREGWIFVDADYSQIELRVLAHLSGDENLISAFRSHQDIHRSTAALVFHKSFDEVTPQERRSAKAVNFGIVYGISAFGLSEDLHISRSLAQQYIDDYYVAYPKLKVYLDGLIKNAKETGASYTMYGRRRPIPELSSGEYMKRSFGERVAMNSPVQGTAADIIKIAMLRVFRRLKQEKMRSELLLQVHDELLIEAPEEEEEKVFEILHEEMEHAAELAVDLEIDVHSGLTWYDAK